MVRKAKYCLVSNPKAEAIAKKTGDLFLTAKQQVIKKRMASMSVKTKTVSPTIYGFKIKKPVVASAILDSLNTEKSK